MCACAQLVHAASVTSTFIQRHIFQIGDDVNSTGIFVNLD